MAIGNTYVRRDTNAKTHIHFSSNEYTKCKTYKIYIETRVQIETNLQSSVIVLPPHVAEGLSQRTAAL